MCVFATIDDESGVTLLLQHRTDVIFYTAFYDINCNEKTRKKHKYLEENHKKLANVNLYPPCFTLFYTHHGYRPHRKELTKSPQS